MTVRRYTDLAGAAIYLGMSEKAIRHKVAQLEIPHIRIDKKLRFKFDDLDFWMDRHRIEASPS